MEIEFLDRLGRRYHLSSKDRRGINLAQPHGSDLSPYAFSVLCPCFPLPWV